jgi:hypothetical protein
MFFVDVLESKTYVQDTKTSLIKTFSKSVLRHPRQGADRGCLKTLLGSVTHPHCFDLSHLYLLTCLFTVHQFAAVVADML